MSNPMSTSSTPARSADAADDRRAAQAGARPRSTTSTLPPPIHERRDRYIDALRALALLRIVTYHQFGWHWLPLAYPSIGILFALAGALVARSLTRARGNYWTVLARRTRRLLPPLWVFGLVLIPVMFLHGWTATTAGGGDPLRHWRLMFFWLLPLADPPGSDWGYDFVLPLWYIRCYLWLLLLSPALLFLFRRWPKRLIAVPLAIVAASTFGIIDLSNGRGAGALLDVGIYGACWMLGFAHHDGSIRTIRTSVIVPTGVVLLAGGLTWAITHQTDTGWDIDNIPPAATLYSLGAVLLLLRFYPSLKWMSRFPALDKTLMMISSRAMTIFLWHNLAIFLAVPLLDSNRVTALADNDTPAGSLARYAATWLLTIAATFLFGWVEDLAARRPPKINPWPRTARRTELTPSPATAPRLARMPLRNHPILLACAVITAAALATGLLLWPWNQQPHRSTATSIGKPVHPYPGVTSTPSPPPPAGPTTNNQSPPPGGPAGDVPATSSGPAPRQQSTGATAPGAAVPPPSAATSSTRPVPPSSAASGHSTSPAPTPTQTPTNTSAPTPTQTSAPTPTLTSVPTPTLTQLTPSRTGAPTPAATTPLPGNTAAPSP